ncbi:MAG: TRM11 family SAM-dependent methyltransferase, partial [Brevinema sp.]
IRKLANAIQVKSKGTLYNSVSDYDVEFRLLEGKDDTYVMFVKLYTILDERFLYRQYALPTSMQPYVAASVIKLIEPYTKEKARVLDMCCGTGTLLLERHMINKTHFLMGLDIFGDAVKMGKYNSECANIRINYVQRDFNSFVHTHKFDEIISYLPSQSANKSRDEIEQLYMKYFKKAYSLIEEDGYLFIYTSEIGIIKKVMRFYKVEFELVEDFIIQLKNSKAVLLVLKSQ